MLLDGLIRIVMIVIDGFEIQPDQQADEEKNIQVKQGVDEIIHGLARPRVYGFSTGRLPVTASRIRMAVRREL